MDYYEKEMINVVNRNHDCKALADKLNAISARRRRRKCLCKSMKSDEVGR